MKTHSPPLLSLLLSLSSFVVCSCVKHISTNDKEEIVFSTTNHIVTIEETKSSNGYNGAYLFLNSDNIHDKNSHGGFFNVKAYESGKSNEHFRITTTVMYHTDTQNPAWYFYNPEDKELEQRYWPQTYDLDFLAYMPLKRPDDPNLVITQDVEPNTYITGFGYDTQSNSPTFTCTGLPLNKEGQATVKEFLHAWTPGQSHDYVTKYSNGKVKLEFTHSMAAVSVKIAGAHGSTTINSLGFTNIYSGGTFNVRKSEWLHSGARKDLSISEIFQTIPDDIQPGHIYGPYLVLPQEHDEIVEIAINFVWRGNIVNAVKQLNSEWEAGKHYTYSLTLGDSAEDIMVNVAVTEWDSTSIGNQEIEVK